MEGKIVYQGITPRGTVIIIRYPEPIDAPAMTEYINALSDERTFVTYQGEHETLESETKFLSSTLEKIRNKRSIMLLVFGNSNLVGISGIELGIKTNRHVGVLGISIAKNFRGEGTGKLLMEYILKEGVNNLPGLEIITLGVFSENKLAINWYKKLGFIESGRFPKGVKLENGYQDHIYMYMSVK